MSTRVITPRLLLRELTPGDLPEVKQLLQDPEVMRFWPRPYTDAECVEWIDRQCQRYRDHGCGYWLALDADSGKAVGQMGVLMMSWQGSAEPALGYILSRRYWRRGYAVEGAKGCIGFVFDTLKRDRVLCWIRPENLPSLAVAQKLGMQKVGEAELAGFDHHIYALSRTVYRSGIG